MPDEPNRITVTLGARAQNALGTATAITGLSKTEVVNRALRAYAFLEEASAAGAKILIRRDDTTEEVRFL